MEQLNVREIIRSVLKSFPETGIGFNGKNRLSDSGGGSREQLAVGNGMLEQVIAVLGERLPRDQFLRCVISIGDAFREHGELSRAEEMYTIALAHGELHGEYSATGEALIRRGDVLCQLGRWKQSNADLTLGRKIYRSLNEELGIVHAESILAINFAVGGDVKRARTYVKRTLDWCERLEETVLAGVAQMNLGDAYRILGDYDKAMTQFQRARSHFEEEGDLARLSEVHYKLGATLMVKRAFADALHQFERCGSLNEKTTNRTLGGLACLGKAKATCSLGDLRMALILADQALNHFSILDDRLHVAEVYRIKGMIHREMKKVEFAQWYLYTSLKINLDLENAYNVGNCYFEIGKLHALRRKHKDAKNAFRKSLECFRKGGATGDARRATAELNRLKEKD